MTERKMERYIITDINNEPDALGTRLYCLHGGIFAGAPYLDIAWFTPQPKERVVVNEGHVHDFEEVITFFGSNPDDHTDLCGEIEIWLDGEPYTLTKSCIIFVPQGVEHCPLIIKRADRPIFHFATGTGAGYQGPQPAFKDEK